MTKRDDKRVLKDITKVVDKLLYDLDMRDWTVQVYYSPDNTTAKIAEVGFSINKQAEIYVYNYRPAYLVNDLRHELLHCKVGFIRCAYETVVEKQNEMIGELAQRYEEMVVDNLEHIIDKYDRKK